MRFEHEPTPCSLPAVLCEPTGGEAAAERAGSAMPCQARASGSYRRATNRVSPIRVSFDPVSERSAHMIDELRAAAGALNQGDPEPLATLIAKDAEWRGISHGVLWWKRTPS
jgi:hypothetical protein